MRDDARAQTTLAGLAIALVLVTTVTAGTVVVADRTLVDATGDPLERRRAVQAAESLSTDPPAHLTTVPGTLDAASLNETNASRLADAIPALRGVDFRVTLDGDTVAARGPPDDGTTVARGVAVVTTRTETETIDLGDGDSTTIGGRTGEIRVDVDPAGETTVETIRVGDRVVLHRPTGIEGSHVVAVSRDADPVVRVEAAGDAVAGRVTASAVVAERRTATLEVTVDA